MIIQLEQEKKLFLVKFLLYLKERSISMLLKILKKLLKVVNFLLTLHSKKMLETNLNTPSITKSVSQVLLKDCKIKIQFDTKIINKIKYLCRQIYKDEWSGVLFYAVEGTIADPQNMLITLKDLYPMHKGSGTYTEYDYSEKVINFRMDNPETNYFRIGHMHSHNTMATFFSGTDTSELHDNSVFHNYYLSVIVNDYFDVTARVAFRGKTRIGSITGVNENGESYTIESSTEEEVMFYYECDIVIDDPSIVVDDSFKASVAEIIEEASKPKVPVAGYITPVTQQYSGYISGSKWNTATQKWELPLAPEPKRYTFGSEDEENYNASDQYFKKKEVGVKEVDLITLAESIAEDEDEDELRNADIEDFLVQLLTSHPDFVDEINYEMANMIILEDAFVYIDHKVKTNKESIDYINYIMEHFAEAYDSEFTEEGSGIDLFMSDLEKMIEMVEEFREAYKIAGRFLQALINLQKQMENVSSRKINAV
jgi:hypothetical protein